MSNGAFSKFIHLVEFDKETLSLEHTKDNLIGQQANLKKAIDHYAQLLEQATIEYKKKSYDVKELEAMLEKLDDQQRAQEKKVDDVSSSKEYSSLQHSIQNLKIAQSALEPKIHASWNEHDKQKKAMQLAQKNKDEYAQSYETMRSKLQEQLQNVQQNLDRRLQERDTLLPNILPELLDKYQGLKHRLSDPIVALENNSCSACHQIIPHQQVNRIIAHSLEQCSNCFRFLYCAQKS